MHCVVWCSLQWCKQCNIYSGATQVGRTIKLLRALQLMSRFHGIELHAIREWPINTVSLNWMEIKKRQTDRWKQIIWNLWSGQCFSRMLGSFANDPEKLHIWDPPLCKGWIATMLCPLVFLPVCLPGQDSPKTFWYLRFSHRNSILEVGCLTCFLHLYKKRPLRKSWWRWPF